MASCFYVDRATNYGAEVEDNEEEDEDECQHHCCKIVGRKVPTCSLHLWQMNCKDSSNDLRCSAVLETRMRMLVKMGRTVRMCLKILVVHKIGACYGEYNVGSGREIGCSRRRRIKYQDLY